MSGFNLDVDFPYPVESKIENQKKPDKLNYSDNKIRFKHFGKNISSIIEKIKKVKDEKTKNYLTKLIVNYLKKSSQQWNKNSMDNRTLKSQFIEMSNGELDFPNDFNNYK